MPARVSRTMIQTANRKTVTITVVSPMPNRIISTGTRAESGALTKMLTQMPNNSSTALNRPISTPSVTPTTMAKRHADDEAVQRDQRGRLPGAGLHQRRPPATSTLESGGMRNSSAGPADDFPYHAPDEQRCHHRHAIAEQDHGRLLNPRIACSPCQISSTVSR